MLTYLIEGVPNKGAIYYANKEGAVTIQCGTHIYSCCDLVVRCRCQAAEASAFSRLSRFTNVVHPCLYGKEQNN